MIVTAGEMHSKGLNISQFYLNSSNSLTHSKIDESASGHAFLRREIDQKHFSNTETTPLDKAVNTQPCPQKELMFNFRSACTDKRLIIIGFNKGGLLRRTCAVFNAFLMFSLPVIVSLGCKPKDGAKFRTVSSSDASTAEDAPRAVVQIPARIEAKDIVYSLEKSPGNAGDPECTIGNQPDVDLGKHLDGGGGCYVGWTEEGEFIDWVVNTHSDKAEHFNIDFRIASPDAASAMEVILMNGWTHSVTANQDGYVPAIDNWVTRSLNGVVIPPGDQRLRIAFKGQVNINAVEFKIPHVPIIPKEATPIPSKLKGDTFVDGTDLTEGNLGTESCKNPYSADVDLEAHDKLSAEAGCYISHTQDGESVDFLVTTNLQNPIKLDFSIRLASEHIDSAVIVEMFKATHVFEGNTKGWNNWKVKTVKNIEVPKGPHRIRLSFKGQINIDSIEFVPAAAAPKDDVDIAKSEAALAALEKLGHELKNAEITKSIVQARVDFESFKVKQDQIGRSFVCADIAILIATLAANHPSMSQSFITHTDVFMSNGGFCDTKE